MLAVGYVADGFHVGRFSLIVIGMLAAKLVAAAPHVEHVRLLGPAEAPLAVVRGRYRFRILAKSPRGFDLSGYLRGWLTQGPKPKGNLKLEVDVDPQSFL